MTVIDRILASWPDAFPQRWSEATVSAATLSEADDLVARLRPPFRTEETTPHDLAPAAKAANEATTNAR